MDDISKLQINSIVAATVDIGDGGMPGTAAGEILCEITARQDGCWDATGECSTGSNQGSYQCDYSYGPWGGRGDTPSEAVDDMVARADEEYQPDMRRAGHDALLKIQRDATFASLAGVEKRRLQSVIESGRSGQRTASSQRATIAGRYFWCDDPTALRTRAIEILSDCCVDVRRRDLLLAARREYQSDEIMIDDNATFSSSDDGVWVSAWVWLGNDDQTEYRYDQE